MALVMMVPRIFSRLIPIPLSVDVTPQCEYPDHEIHVYTDTVGKYCN